MSLKDDVNYIKKELSGDEKVLESAFKIETLYRKHKLKFAVALVAVVVFFAGKGIEGNMKESALLEANKAFMTLQVKADDKEALATLKENNPALFDVYSYTQAVKDKDIKTLEALSTSKNAVISDASAYHASILKNKPKSSMLYDDMVLFTQGYLAIKEGKGNVAKVKLEQIDERSPLATITGFLKHSMIKAN
ncbi:hypothetical protein MNB_SV-13-1678 [hydrothermal vent metagenome]|uniref:Tetratricopeptide repeat-like domain-containing protein n=1 Tax=hydrothermal vent metagenome TaxID=652676 RepID=A0A1W1CGT7_9ZZZZ